MSEDLTQPIITEQRKTPISSILFTVLLVALVLIAGFFGYQNYQLKQEMLGINAITSVPPTIAPTITPVEAADPTAGWKIYLDPYEQYSFRYPQTYSLDTAARPYLNRNITWSFENNSFSSCRGDCPFVSSSIETTLGGKPATKISGYIGSVGGNVPQSYVAYEVVSGNKYFIFQIEALPFEMSREEYVQYSQSDIQPIKSEDLRMFDQILSTFKFIEPVVSPTPQISYLRPEISDTSSWKLYTLKNIQFKAPEEARVSITDGDAVITLPEAMIPSANVMLRAYDGGPRREWWIKEINATPDEVSKYMRFQDVMLGKVAALDVFGDGGWWQGGYASPILIAKGKTIIAIHGGRGLNPETGKTSRYIFSDSVASTIKFIQ